MDVNNLVSDLSIEHNVALDKETISVTGDGLKVKKVQKGVGYVLFFAQSSRFEFSPILAS